VNVGVDLGGVVIDSSGPDTFFGPDYLSVPPVYKAFDSIARLNAVGKVFIVSKCGPRIEEQSRHWLAAHDFEKRTGVAEDRWHFVRARPDKALVAYVLELDAFVDDREDVLEVMPPPVHRVRFGSPQTPGWPQVMAALNLRARQAGQPLA